MFFQVRVRKEGQDLLRFLWWPNGNLENEPEEYCMTVHLFGAGSSPACLNFAYRCTAYDNEGEYSVHLRKELKSTPTEEEAVDISRKLKEQCAKGGFISTKFVGNTKGFINSTPLED